jgi:hypothetical protein
MDVTQHFQRLFALPLGQQPPWAFWDCPNENELEDRRESLHDGWNAPAPIGSDLSSPKSQPRGDDGTQIPRRIIDGSEDRAILRMDELRDEERASTVGNGNAKTNPESSCYEHAKGHANALQDNSEDPTAVSYGNKQAAKRTDIMTQPIRMAMRRPRISAVYGTNGMATKLPTDLGTRRSSQSGDA